MRRKKQIRCSNKKSNQNQNKYSNDQKKTMESSFTLFQWLRNFLLSRGKEGKNQHETLITSKI